MARTPACPLTGLRRALSHPARSAGGDTIFEVGALIAPVLTSGVAADLLSGLAAHGMYASPQAKSEHRLVPWHRTVYSEPMRHNVTEVSALFCALDMGQALAILDDHLKACHPEAWIVQAHLGGAYTSLPMSFPTTDPRPGR